MRQSMLAELAGGLVSKRTPAGVKTVRDKYFIAAVSEQSLGHFQRLRTMRSGIDWG